MGEYSPYDTIAEYYFDLVALFLALELDGAVSFDASIETASDDHRVITFKGRGFKGKFEPHIKIDQDFGKDGTPTKPWTSINGNDMGRLPIWGIDELNDEEDLDEIEEIKQKYNRKMKVLNTAISYLSFPGTSISLQEPMISEIEKTGSSKEEFVKGAQSYAEDIFQYYKE
jgi:hypothetical protein